MPAGGPGCEPTDDNAYDMMMLVLTMMPMTVMLMPTMLTMMC
jgi:hypothetical protein